MRTGSKVVKFVANCGYHTEYLIHVPDIQSISHQRDLWFSKGGDHRGIRNNSLIYT